MARGKGKTVGGAPAQAAPPSVPSPQYGAGVAQQQALAAVPLPDNSAPPIPPGGLGPLNAPTANPKEPITAGASFGPGAHLGDLQFPTPPDPGQEVDAVFLSNYLPMLESLASSDGSSYALRSWVRRLRESVPPDFEPVTSQAPSNPSPTPAPSAPAPAPAAGGGY